MGKKSKRRRLYQIRRRTKPGAPPGTVATDPHAHETTIDVFGYGPSGYVEEAGVTPERVSHLIGKWPVTWVNVEGGRNVDVVRRIAELFALHPLVLEDVVNVHQRAKVEEYGEQLFVVVRMMMLDAEGEIETEQLAIVLGRDFVATFQERPGDVLGPVRERIRSGRQIRRERADHLMYAIVDAVVDHYFPVLERIGERVEALEEEVIDWTDETALAKIHKLKRDLLMLRRAVWPQRDAMAALQRDPLPNVSDATRVYLRDCHDHAVQVMDLLESYREMAGALLEVYLSRISNRLNEVMKVLTIFSSVFIPLTFVTGIYGMNFDTETSPWNMPELEWRYGYALALALMAVIAATTLGYFRYKGWLGGARRTRRGAAAAAESGNTASRI